MYKYLLPAILCLVLVSLVLGCGAHNPRKVSKTVKASIQKTFDTEPQYANLKPVLSDLKLEMIDPSHYKGIAKVEVKGKNLGLRDKCGSGGHGDNLGAGGLRL